MLGLGLPYHARHAAAKGGNKYQMNLETLPPQITLNDLLPANRGNIVNWTGYVDYHIDVKP